MFTLGAAALALVALTDVVSAHGYLKFIKVGTTTYPAWNVGVDDYITPTPVRYSRRLLDNGPVPDFTGKDITCGRGGNVPAAGIIPVTAGTKVQLIWDQWGSSHSGPVMTYLAKCVPNCANFKGDTGAVWIKIDQGSYDPPSNPPWASDKVRTQGAKWTVTIPPTIAPGEYLLRHEILGLHVAGQRMGAQFYPSCTQLRISGSGTQNPAGIALPGSYNPDDTSGILVQLWQIQQGQRNYTAPGGKIWSGSVLPNLNTGAPQ